MSTKPNYSLTIWMAYIHSSWARMVTEGIYWYCKNVRMARIKAEIGKHRSNSQWQKPKDYWFAFWRGAQDREQEIVMKDLMKKKDAITEHIEGGKPALFVCGAPQLIGSIMNLPLGKGITDLGFFDMVSKHPGPKTIGWLAMSLAKWLGNRHASKAKQSQKEIATSPLATSQWLSCRFLKIMVDEHI